MFLYQLADLVVFAYLAPSARVPNRSLCSCQANSRVLLLGGKGPTFGQKDSSF